jgi:hypothetical protein
MAPTVSTEDFILILHDSRLWLADTRDCRPKGIANGTALSRLDLTWWDTWDTWANTRGQLLCFQSVRSAESLSSS